MYGNDPEVLATAATLVLFIALYQIADDTQATVAGVLRGFKDTRVPMFISLVGDWIIALPIGAWLGFGDYGVYGFWIGLTVGLAAVAMGVSGRFASTSRNTARIRRSLTLWLANDGRTHPPSVITWSRSQCRRLERNHK